MALGSTSPNYPILAYFTRSPDDPITRFFLARSPDSPAVLSAELHFASNFRDAELLLVYRFELLGERDASFHFFRNCGVIPGWFGCRAAALGNFGVACAGHTHGTIDGADGG